MRASPKPRLPLALAVALAGVGVVGLLAWTWRGPARAPEPGAPAELLPSPAPPAPAAAPTSPPTAPPPVVGAGAPPGCPEDDVDPPGFVRPSVWESLRVRTSELRDRVPQLSREASPELGEGLRALALDPRADTQPILSASDRDRDGFDVAVAALLHAGMRALAEDDLDTARRLVEVAEREAPADPLPFALSSLVEERAGALGPARAAIGRAHQLDPDEAAIALADARAASAAWELDEARAAVRTYLAAVPEDARTATWADRLDARAQMSASLARRSHDGITVLWPRERIDTQRVDRLQDVLTGALDEVARLIGRPRLSELAVVIYGDRESMRRATCAPSWSGGIFDGVLHLDADAMGRPGSGWERAVRHEGTHAALSVLRGPIPHWLNEGLAQRMEGPVAPGALASWTRMRERRFFIPLASLEGELVGIDDPDDAQLAYHQSLAMVEWLISARGERGLARAADAIDAQHGEGLLEALVPDASGEALLAFLQTRLDADPVPAR